MATSNGSSTLTEKQQQVFDFLAEGKTPSQAAALMSLKGSAVHSHIARLKAKGFLDKNGKVVKAKAKAIAAPATPPVAPEPEPATATPANGSGILGDVGSALSASRAALKETIVACESADAALSQRIEEIDRTTKALDVERGDIGATRVSLKQQGEQLQAALEALPA